MCHCFGLVHITHNVPLNSIVQSTLYSSVNMYPSGQSYGANARSLDCLQVQFELTPSLSSFSIAHSIKPWLKTPTASQGRELLLNQADGLVLKAWAHNRPVLGGQGGGGICESGVVHDHGNDTLEVKTAGCLPCDVRVHGLQAGYLQTYMLLDILCVRPK